MFKDYSEQAKLDFCLENQIEFWKEIPSYKGIYSISTFGNVRNNQTGRILKPQNNKPDGSGYLDVKLCKKGEINQIKIHKLVLETFVGKCPKDYECDHKDTIRTNNKLENLHWVTHTQNCRNKSTNRKVNQYDLEGNYIKTFGTISEAAETLGRDNLKTISSHIQDCCKGRYKKVYGYKWTYADEK